MSAIAQPTLSVGGETLRPWTTDDADAVVAAYDYLDIQRWHARTMTSAEALAWVGSWPDRWRAETGAGWAITTGDVVVGRVGLRVIELAEGWAEAAYWVLPAARGRGVASRALDAVTTWMFEQVGLHRVELSHSTDNPASCRVALKAGFAVEGTRRSQVLHADGWHDMHLHARVSDT